MARIRSKILYVEKHVSIYTIPAEELQANESGDLGLDLDRVSQGERDRDFGASSSAPVQIWYGSLKVVQEELDEDDEEYRDVDVDSINKDETVAGTNPRKPFHTIKLKLVFFNKIADEFVPWAEVWYNPLDKPLDYFSIAKNGEETISLISDTCQKFKVIAQFPGTGYHPIEGSPEGSEKDEITQVALELRFSEVDQGLSFLEALDKYHVNYSSVVDSYLYESQLAGKTASLTLDSSDLEEEQEEDDFGDFVAA
ncbi:hypothetical protein CLIB1423_10S05358 [[Candida] railenensis]|uniref:Uncharacterized protein n=1 Tax=[Candida] railenensis TaxID=45579 RepID=A0A9P0VY92_9ASCO|nr:hypothetical protein CLIB1423_10S05358 [[Candida] railenensis]